jgi:DNA-binding HxlR family transcriptional regulator
MFIILFMVKKSKIRNTGCPVAFALDIFGDRWSLVIIRDLLIKKFKTYGELLNCDEKIATNILSDRLKTLEQVGILTKHRDQENKRKYNYKLTNMGLELAAIITDMIVWSAKYDQQTKVPAGLLERILKDREGFILELTKSQ